MVCTRECVRRSGEIAALGLQWYELDIAADIRMVTLEAVERIQNSKLVPRSSNSWNRLMAIPFATVPLSAFVGCLETRSLDRRCLTRDKMASVRRRLDWQRHACLLRLRRCEGNHDLASRQDIRIAKQTISAFDIGDGDVVLDGQSRYGITQADLHVDFVAHRDDVKVREPCAVLHRCHVLRSGRAEWRRKSWKNHRSTYPGR